MWAAGSRFLLSLAHPSPEDFSRPCAVVTKPARTHLRRVSRGLTRATNPTHEEAKAHILLHPIQCAETEMTGPSKQKRRSLSYFTLPRLPSAEPVPANPPSQSSKTEETCNFHTDDLCAAFPAGKQGCVYCVD